jgi:hypothetical protein
MDTPKILLVSTINIVKDYCLYDWLEHIKKLSYPNIDIFLVDNSFQQAFCEKIKGLGYNCVYESPNIREARFFMAASMERCRVKFLAGDYDYCFSLECDIFPQLDIIEKLLSYDMDVVGTTYWTDHGFNSHLQLQKIFCRHIDVQKHVKEYKVMDYTFEEAQLFIDGTCKPVFANGLGCVLIKREILENIKFRVDAEDVGFADSFFYMDLWKAGIDNYVDTSIIPLHRNSNWNAVLSDSKHKKMQIERGDTKANK